MATHLNSTCPQVSNQSHVLAAGSYLVLSSSTVASTLATTRLLSCQFTGLKSFDFQGKNTFHLHLVEGHSTRHPMSAECFHLLRHALYHVLMSVLELVDPLNSPIVVMSCYSDSML